MRDFLISYDLSAPSRNKHEIATAIMAMGQSWARPLAQTWIIKTDLDVELIESRLARLLDDDDGLLVQPVSDTACFTNTSLRWFRQRRPDSGETNVVVFPNVTETQPPVDAQVFAVAS